MKVNRVFRFGNVPWNNFFFFLDSRIEIQDFRFWRLDKIGPWWFCHVSSKLKAKIKGYRDPETEAAITLLQKPFFILFLGWQFYFFFKMEKPQMLLLKVWRYR